MHIYSLFIVLSLSIFANASAHDDARTHSRRVSRGFVAARKDSEVHSKDPRALGDFLFSLLGPVSTDLTSGTSTGTSSSPSSSSSSSASTSGTDSSASASATDTSVSATTTATDAETTTTSNGGLGGILSGVLGGVTSVVGDVGSALTTDPTSTTVSDSDPTITDAPTTTTDSTTESTTEATSSSSDGGILSGILSGILPAPSSSSEAEVTSDAPASTSGGILSGILSGIIPAPSSTSEPEASQSDAPITTEAPEPSSSGGGFFSSIFSEITDILPDPSSSSGGPQVTDPPASSGSPDLPVSSIFSSIFGSAEPSGFPSVFPSGSAGVSSEFPEPSGVPSGTSDFPEPSGFPSGSITSGFPEPSGSASSGIPSGSQEPSGVPSGSASSLPPSGSASVVPSGSASGSGSGSSIPPPSSSVVITFPSGTPTSSFGVSPSSASEEETSTQEWWETISGLAIATVTRTTASADSTLTDPDAATTTLSQGTADPTPVTTFSAAPIPSNLPYRIYPREGYVNGKDLSDLTFISLRMDDAYPWEFVVGSSVASAQLLAYTRVQVGVALGLTNADVLPYSLQVYIPDSYKDASDIDELGTQCLMYIPTDQVDALASQLRVKTSEFYTGGTISDAQALVAHVMASSSLLSVDAPEGDGSGGDSPSNSGATSSSTRQDAIIGVTSALGGIAVITLLFLVWRTVQRRKEQAHRRLSDPPGGYDAAGIRPDGREFDQDTIGGQRRRSFFYAEDSLRGFDGGGATSGGGGRGDQDEWITPDRVSPQMGQRRHVMPATISPPILRESSMNW